MGIWLAVLLPAGVIVVYLAVALYNGGKSTRAQMRFKEWRSTGKGLLDNMDQEQNDIDKYMR